MKHNQSNEDYLETILLLSRELEAVHRIEIARKMEVSQPAVQKAMKLLIKQGYVSVDGMHIRLTQAGQAYAEKIYNMHCVLKQFLINLGVSEDIAEKDACEIEHCISDETFATIEKAVKGNKS